MKTSLVRMMMSVALSALVALAAPAFAEGKGGHGGSGQAHRGKGIDKRIQRQKHRIEQGVEKGKLTADQAKKLEADVGKIEAEKNAATANGQKLGTEQKQKLNQELNETGKEIRELKHPGKGAVPAVPAVPANQ